MSAQLVGHYWPGGDLLSGLLPTSFRQLLASLRLRRGSCHDGTCSSRAIRFDYLASFSAGASSDDRLGVCIDTCHVFAAGYDLRTPEAYQATLDEFDRVVGLDRLCTFQFNDSQQPLGSRRDRHAHIGEHKIGLDGSARCVNTMPATAANKSCIMVLSTAPSPLT